MKEVFKNKKHNLLIPYLTAGDPDLETTKVLIEKLAGLGVDAIEIGVPFSDSLADGPTIVESHLRALTNGTTLPKIFSMVTDIRKKVSVPIFLMLAYNLIFKFGIEKFVAEAQKADISGYIIPDLPPEETPHILAPTYLVAPTTIDSRLQDIVSKSNHFVYLVSTTGVTGKRKQLPKGLGEFVKKVKKETAKPVLVGFGISNEVQAQSISSYADGVIIGSAFVEKVHKDLSEAMDFIAKIRNALQ